MSKPNVLFVDDEVRVVRSLKVLFSTQGDFTVHIATSGTEALEIVQSVPFHVVVSDQRMPEITGVKLLQRVKQLSPNTVGILLTGYADMDAIIASINEGEVFRYITKPWQNQQLKQKIRSAMEIANKLYSEEAVPNFQGLVEYTDPNDVQNIIVLHPRCNNNIALLVAKLFPQHKIYAISSIEQAVDQLTKKNISVVVTDMGSNTTNCADLVKILKQAYPLALAVIITDSADSRTAIALINQGQVYRYLPKPIKTGRLKLSISSALAYYRHCESAPVALPGHSESKIESTKQSIPNGKFRTRLSLLTKRIFSSIASE